MHFEVFSGRGGPANKHSRPKDLLDAEPDFGLLDEITATRGLLAYFHSRDKVGLRCQTTTQNLTGKLICALEFVTYDETTRPEQIAAVVQALKRNPPAYLFLLTVTPGATAGGDHAAPIRQFVYDNYSLANVFPVKQSHYEQELWRR